VGDHEAVGAETTEREGISRRGFIAGAAGLTGVALSGVWRSSPALADSAGEDVVRTPTGVAFLELEGKIVGSLKQAGGGGRYGEVVSEPPDENGDVDKHLGALKQNDVFLKAGLGMSKPFYDWVSAFCAGSDPGHEGAVILADLNFNAKSRMDFQGFIREVAFPASDGASKEPAYMTVKIFAESTASKKATGTISAALSNQHLWLPANFRVDIDGLDSTHVAAVDGFAVRQEIFDRAGGARFTLPKPQADTLGFHLPVSFANTWTGYLDDFLDGQVGETTGKIEWRNPTLQKVLASVEFANMGLFRLDADPVPGSTDAIRKVHAEMYCEQVVFRKFP
jgi:hypothetical protein